jgi:alpha-D-ribose 1-methylphosphonate 5-triphosphate diphosphatase
MGALRLPHVVSGTDLASSVRTVTKSPAEAVGLNDREIAVGRRADLVRVNLMRELPVVRTVWRAGERVA